MSDSEKVVSISFSVFDVTEEELIEWHKTFHRLSIKAAQEGISNTVHISHFDPEDDEEDANPIRVHE